MSRDFLLEIGCEDIPARMLPGAQTSLKELLEAELKSRGLLSRAAVQTWATPRRLVAYCKEVLPAEADRTEQEIGPPYSVAYDAAGNPTRAAQSFARKHNVPLSKLTAVNTAKGRYVAVVRHHRGRPARKVLAKVLPSLIGRIFFPRSMYWTSPQEMRFIRPIRWLLALYAGEVINFELAGIKSGRFSRGHRLLANRRIAIRRASDYRAQLRRAFVLVDPEERRKKIEQEIPRALRRSPLQAREDKELLDLVVNQTECPTVLRGGFREEFLSLPSEVLVTVMRHHQKYFSVETEKGTVAPHFLTVIDLDRDQGGEVRRGHESVLEARFRDARFFWETDQRQHLAGRIELLKDIVFQARLGSYANKVERLVQLSRWLGKNANPPDGRHADIAGRHADIQTVERAASLCKADLTTLLVGEFPELQGIVGGLYARAQGEPQAIATAIAEHYRPLGPDDKIPQTLEGGILALADKIDSLAGCFSVGAVPTGSKDPFALRRAAAGVVRIIVEQELRLDIEKAVRQATATVREQLPDAGSGDPSPAIMSFIEERARYFFREVAGYPYDEVNAVFAAGWDDLTQLKQRLEALHRIRPTPDFEPLAISFKRIRNILEKAGGPAQFARGQTTENLMEAGAERGLYDAFRRLRSQVAALRQAYNYAEALRHIASLRPVVDNYFDVVLVNASDPAVRQNRLTLLAQLLQEFSTIADFSEIVAAPKTRGRTNGTSKKKKQAQGKKKAQS